MQSIRQARNQRNRVVTTRPTTTTLSGSGGDLRRLALTPTLSRKREREIRSGPLAPRSGERVRERGPGPRRAAPYPLLFANVPMKSASAFAPASGIALYIDARMPPTVR
jgi:hypothetical protein